MTLKLKCLFPKEILNRIFQYDSTYSHILVEILYSDEMKYKLWELWKKQLFMCSKFKNDNVFLKKMECILNYHFDHIDREFPENIEIYYCNKLFYYSNKEEDPNNAFQIFLNRNLVFKRNEIEASFMFSDGSKKTITGQVFTKDQYYKTFVFVYKDIYPDLFCVHKENNLYLLQNYYDIEL